MKTLHFSMMINAPRHKVWHVMLDKETYSKWTSAFMKGAYYEGSWQRGKRIKFLGPDTEGMSAVIAENKPYEFISIKHLGPVIEGFEYLDLPESNGSSFGFENYTFSKKNGGTELRIDLDVEAEYEDQMKVIWPKALAKLKKICETHTHGEDHSSMGELKSKVVL